MPLGTGSQGAICDRMQTENRVSVACHAAVRGLLATTPSNASKPQIGCWAPHTLICGRHESCWSQSFAHGTPTRIRRCCTELSGRTSDLATVGQGRSGGTGCPGQDPPHAKAPPAPLATGDAHQIRRFAGPKKKYKDGARGGAVPEWRSGEWRTHSRRRHAARDLTTDLSAQVASWRTGRCTKGSPQSPTQRQPSPSATSKC